MKSDEPKVKAIAEGAIAAALATILALTGFYLPPLALVASLVWVIPIVVVTTRYGLNRGAMSLLAATLVLMVFSNPVSGLLFALQLGLVGLAFGHGFKNRWPAGKTVLVGGLAVVLSSLLIIGLSMFFLGINPGEWHQEMTHQLDHTIEFYRQWGLINDGAVSEAEIKASVETFVRFTGLLIPGILVSGGFFTALVNFLIVRVIIKRLGVEVAAIPPFRAWQLPWLLVWGIIGGLGLFLLGDFYRFELFRTAGINILYIYLPILLVGGLSVLTYFNYYVKIARWIKIVIGVILIVNLPFSMLFLVTLGLFDPLFDYRRLAKKA